MAKLNWTFGKTLCRALALFFIISSLIICTSLWGCESAFSKTTPVAFEIDSIGQRFVQSEALVVLNFKNQTKTKITVPFCAMQGKGDHEKVTRQFVNLTNRQNDFNEGGDFCRFTYKWYRPRTPEISGYYESNHGAIEIAHLASGSIQIPIKCPTEPGVYSLTVTFDNSTLQSVLNTYNSPQGFESNVYFSASTESMFKISAVHN